MKKQIYFASALLCAQLFLHTASIHAGEQSGALALPEAAAFEKGKTNAEKFYEYTLRTIKVGIKNGVDSKSLALHISSAISNFQHDQHEEIHDHCVTQFAQRIYRKYNKQFIYFDGTIRGKHGILDGNAKQSPWYPLSMYELVIQYITVNNAHDYSLPYPGLSN